MLKRRNFILGGVALAGCASTRSSDPISADEYEIFNAHLNTLPCRDTNVKDLFITETLETPNPGSFWNIKPVMTHGMQPKRGEVVNIPEDVIEQFHDANRAPVPIQTGRIENKCVEFVSSEKANEISSTLDARKFYDDLRNRRLEALRRGEKPPFVEFPPQTIHSLSRFGFNTQRDYAIGGRREFCGPLCAALILVIAKKQNNEWRIDDELVLLIS